MFVDRKPFIWVWRPFYQRVYTPLLRRVYFSAVEKSPVGSQALVNSPITVAASHKEAVAIEQLALVMLAHARKQERSQTIELHRVLDRLEHLEHSLARLLHDRAPADKLEKVLVEPARERRRPRSSWEIDEESIGT